MSLYMLVMNTNTQIVSSGEIMVSQQLVIPTNVQYWDLPNSMCLSAWVHD